MAHSYDTILASCIACSVLGLAVVVMILLNSEWTLWKIAGLGLVSLLFILVAGVCHHLRRLKPSDTLTLSGFLKFAMLKLMSATLGRYGVWKLRRCYRSRSSMRAVQQAALLKMVKRSRDTIFGLDHKFSEIQGIEDYRSRVPVRDYADLDKYNQLAYKGDPNVYFPGAVEFLIKTSGTTGKNKTFPAAKKFLMEMVSMFMGCVYCTDLFISNSGRQPSMARQLVVPVHPPERKNEFNVPVGPASKFFGSQGDIFTTPLEAIQKVHDAKTAYYIHAVFALWHESISEVNVFFPTSLITLVRCLSANWESVLKDIESGRLNADKVSVDAELLDHLNRRLSPKPERAAQLRSLFGDGQDLSGIFEKAWPNVTSVLLARSGSFQSSYRYLKRYLGNLPTFGQLMGGTEGIVGINLTVNDVDYSAPEHYHPLLNPCFIEYIPVDANGNDIGEAKLTHELQPSCLYETVTTSFNCYRLRTGDVIRVVKMDGCAPVFEISHRKSHVLSVHVEKTTEKSLQACVMLAAKRIGCQVVDFTAADCFLYEPVANVSLGTKYYALFVELDGDKRLSDDEKLVFDKALRDSMENYELFRSEGHIQTMQVLQVKEGAFAVLRQEMMSANKDISEMQFKMPRVIRTEAQVKCLLDSIL